MAFEKKTWKNANDPTLVKGVDPAIDADNMNRIEQGISDIHDISVIDTDPRLSDAREPTAHTHTAVEVTDFDAEVVTHQVNMNTDFSDLRFATASGEEIQYWRESYVAGSSAKFFLKVPANTSEFRVYFGNMGAEYAGDGETVFPYFNDFETLEGITEISGGGTSSYSTDGDLITFNADGTNRTYADLNYDLSGDYTILARAKPIENIEIILGWDGQLTTASYDPIMNGYQVYIYSWGSGEFGICEYEDGSNSYGYGDIVAQSGNWYNLKMDMHYPTFELYVDGILDITRNLQYTEKTGTLALTGREQPVGNVSVYDYIAVQRYLATLPTFSDGSVVDTEGYDDGAPDPLPGGAGKLNIYGMMIGSNA